MEITIYYSSSVLLSLVVLCLRVLVADIVRGPRDEVCL